jgi:hypothetical protein
LEDNRVLRADSARSPIPAGHLAMTPAQESNQAAMPMLPFPRVFRRYENTDLLVRGIVEGLADTARVTRVGMFGREGSGEVFRLRAGLRCLPETYDLKYHERDPLLRWFELHAHLVYRAHLGQNQDHAQRRACDERSIPSVRR